MIEDFETFRSRLVGWLGATDLFPGSRLHVDLIINPRAGALHSRRRLRSVLAALEAAEKGPYAKKGPNRDVRVSTFVTDYPGHEKAILAHLKAADPLGPGDRRLVVTAGGDGTSRGALISALDIEADSRKELVFFRLPLGTGNDGSETRDWDTALRVLSGRSPEPTEVRPLSVIEVRVPGHDVHYAFNIASVGLDAFVNLMTNRFKTIFPGNSYGLMVDVATLFYEAFVRVVPSRLELTKEGRTVLTWDQAFLLAAFGASGHRTYGAGKRILPDSDNFCLAAKKNVFTKLAYRKPFYTGTHRGLSGITLASGDTLSLVTPVPVPLQMDGEDLALEPSESPVTFTIVDRGLQVLAVGASPS